MIPRFAGPHGPVCFGTLAGFSVEIMLLDAIVVILHQQKKMFFQTDVDLANQRWKHERQQLDSAKPGWCPSEAHIYI